MAVQNVTYTGGGLQAPQDKGHTMQALSQFVTQNQQRKTMQIEKGMKDRDDFLNLLKVDPVYLASTAANEKIAKGMENFLNMSTGLYKKGKGVLTTEDLTKIQQHKSALVAEMQYLTGINKEMMEAQKLRTTNPNLVNDEMMEKSVKYFTETGLRPEGGFVFPPQQMLSDLFVSAPGPPQTEGVDIRSVNGEKMRFKTYSDNANVNDRERVRYAINAYRNNASIGKGQYGGLAYHATYGFEDLSPEEQSRLNTVARNMGLQDGIEAYVAEEALRTLWRQQDKVWSAVYQPSGSLSNQGFVVKGGQMYDGRTYLGGIQKNVPSIDGQLPQAVVLSEQVKSTAVPISSLDLPEGVEGVGNMVVARPKVATKDKTYWQVDKAALKNVTFTKKAAEALGSKGLQSFTTNNEGNYVIKEGLEEDVIITSPTYKTSSLIDNLTGNLFSGQISLLPNDQTPKQPEAQEEKRGGFNLGRIGKWFKGETAEAKYRLPDGRIVSRGELSEWSDADIKELLERVE